jgi:hypothetical protein
LWQFAHSAEHIFAPAQIAKRHFADDEGVHHHPPALEESCQIVVAVRR